MEWVSMLMALISICGAAFHMLQLPIGGAVWGQIQGNQRRNHLWSAASPGESLLLAEAHHRALSVSRQKSYKFPQGNVSSTFHFCLGSCEAVASGPQQARPQYCRHAVDHRIKTWPLACQHGVMFMLRWKHAGLACCKSHCLGHLEVFGLL